MRCLFPCTLVFVSIVWSTAHQHCYVDEKLPDPGKTVPTFCPTLQYGTNTSYYQFGSCCTDQEEDEIKNVFNMAGKLSSECGEMYKQVLCGKCHSFSGHLFEELGEDGMTMKGSFCNEVTSACAGQPFVADYPDGQTFCEKHVGSATAGNDAYWSFPFVENDAVETDLTGAFPDVDLPEEPTSLKLSPDGSMYWIVGRSGQIVKVDTNDLTSGTLVLDVQEGSDLDASSKTGEGFTDVAFDPDFHKNGFFYAAYTVNLGTQNAPKGQQDRLSKFTYVPDSATKTFATEEVLLETVEKDKPSHMGGWVGFKPSAYTGSPADWSDLYWSTGDGASNYDPENNGQNVQNYLGSMMRISVSSSPGSAGYISPAGNYQDVDGSAPPEVCAIGLRHPWKCSFDRANDNLYCGDVGQAKMEEVNLIECGKNYGWSRFESSLCSDHNENLQGNPPCTTGDQSRQGFEFPIFEYCHFGYYASNENAAYTNGVDICGDHFKGNAVIGGYVYRGQKFKDVLDGAYVFADYGTSNVYYLVNDGAKWVYGGTIISDKSMPAVSFAEGPDAELMVLTRTNVYNLPCGDLCTGEEGEPSEEDEETSEEYTHVGCFPDTEEARVLLTPLASPDMTIEMCLEHCKTAGALYMGTQWGVECWCSFSYDLHNALVGADAVCDMECAGDKTETCGGYWAFDLYQL